MSGTGVVEVSLGARSYAARVVPGGFDGLGTVLGGCVGARRAVVVSDDVVAPLWAGALRGELERAGFEVGFLRIASGEAHKTLAAYVACVEGLVAAGVDRDTPVVALGGGVVADVAGFAAATALRGLPLAVVPTTVLAMVDAAVGGKNGVNVGMGKNRVGTFHQPVLVWAAMETLRTLPPRERAAGLAEAVKMAVVGDEALLGHLERDAEDLVCGEPSRLSPIVLRSLAIKAEAVSADERDRAGRLVLNFGHTLGHALERSVPAGSWLHGEAVAAGMVLEARWAVRGGLCADEGLPGRLERLLVRIGLPTQPAGTCRERLREALAMDKKARGGMLVLPVPVEAGRMRLVEIPADEAFASLLAEIP